MIESGDCVKPSAPWQLLRFDELDGASLYRILRARVDVFVVEQQCPYQELDGLDEAALHLCRWDKSNALVAYARLLPPGVRFEPPSIGRVLTARAARRTGLGRALMQCAIESVWQHWHASNIRLSAQRYLEPFYASFGFRVDSQPYDEDGIEHVDMVLNRRAALDTGGCSKQRKR